MTITPVSHVRWTTRVFGLWVAVAALLALRPPVPSAAATGFSVDRATVHLAWIARAPHPSGTRAHAAVGDRIRSEVERLGLRVEVQDANYVQQLPGNRTRLVRVRNVLAKREGSGGSDRSVVLMAHYDSQIGSPGAGDNGVGVAALLEAARVVQAGPAPRNDIVFAFTDAEELGLCGARMFVSEHPWARGIGAVINFEARGVRGPAMLFETGDRDGWLIRELIDAAPAPYASSLAPALYRRMPYATDLNVFRGTNVPRLNLAFADGWQMYHTWRDEPASVAPASLLHQGSYAVAMALRLGNADLTAGAAQAHELIYFNLGPWVVRYDQRFALVVPILGAIALLWLMIARLRAGQVRVLQIVVGTIGVLMIVVVASAIAWAFWRVVFQAALTRGALSVLFERSWLSTTALTASTLAVLMLGHRLLKRLAGTDGAAIGALIWLAVLAVLAAVRMPEISYLFAWPLLGGVVMLYGIRGVTATPSIDPRHAIALVIGSALVLFVLMPAIRMLLLAMATLPWMMAPLIALTGAVMSPAIDLMTDRIRWWAPAAAFAAALAAGASCLLPADAASNPRGPTIGVYLASLESGRAVWVSPEPLVLPVDARGGAATEPIERYTPGWYGDWVRRSGAHVADVKMPPAAAPAVSVEPGAADGDHRTLTLRVVSPREAPEVAVCVRSTQGLLAASTGSQRLLQEPRVVPTSMAAANAAPPTCDLIVQSYHQPDGGLPLTVSLPIAAALEVEVVERIYDQQDAKTEAALVRSQDGRIPASMIVTSRIDWAPGAPARR